MFERVLRHDADGICTLTLNPPDKLNALDTLAFEEIDAHLQAHEHFRYPGCAPDYHERMARFSRK